MHTGSDFRSVTWETPPVGWAVGFSVREGEEKEKEEEGKGGGSVWAWLWNHVITVGPVRPVISWSLDTFRAMSTKGASITCGS